MPERFREAHCVDWERAHGDGVTQYVGQSLTTRASNSAGDTITVELRFAIILDDAGAAIRALATARDISERFEQDRANRRRMKELEEELEALRIT